MRSALLILVCLTAAPSASLADDRAKAAEHFALAEKADKRGDYRAAIAEYEAAYAASPHPAILYNIARDYEQLGELRAAADYFRRYLAESPDAEDRAEVERRIADLQAKPSRLQVFARPAGAAVFIDGTRAGEAPLTTEIPAGTHDVYVAHSGKRSPTQRITAEYGEAQLARFDLTAATGTLRVTSNVDRAEVRLDGTLIGYTPITAPVPAGEYQLVITKPNHSSEQRRITVRAGGSEAVRANLTRVGGATDEADDSPAARRTGYWMYGYGYGFGVTGGDDKPARQEVRLGYRLPGRRVDLSGVLQFGAPGTALGAELRVIVLPLGMLSAYARGTALTGATADDRKFAAVEGGGGLMLTGDTGSTFAYDVVFDVAVQQAFRDLSHTAVVLGLGFTISVGR